MCISSEGIAQKSRGWGIKMKVIKIDENKDGSATIHLDMTEEEQRDLIEHVLLDIIAKYIDKEYPFVISDYAKSKMKKKKEK